MPKITIDNREVFVPDGSSVLDAARVLGLNIPTMCYLDGYKPNTSCMVCLVKRTDDGKLIPSCDTKAEEGKSYESETDEVFIARQCAIELLLSDHVGDCIAPCQSACPAGMDIPQMIRQIAAGDLTGAIKTVKRHIPGWAYLCRSCPKFCQRACRRSLHDSEVDISSLVRYLASIDPTPSQPSQPITPKPKPFTVRMGKLKPGEMELFLKNASSHDTITKGFTEASILTSAQAKAEANRCLHCDCRKKISCKLKSYAEKYSADPRKFKSGRRNFQTEKISPAVIFEQGKCINCGLCIQIAGAGNLTFSGRGFDVELSAGFNKTLAEGFVSAEIAMKCAQACPTAALSIIDNP